MIHKILLTLTACTALAGTSFATLIPIGVIPSTGNGIGAVNTVVTFQNAGTESGCVGYIGGATVTGSTACNTAFTGSTGGNETTGSGNNVYTAGDLGLTATGLGGTRTFANVVLIFNGNEGGGPNDAITLTNLSLNLFSTSGQIASFTTAAAQSYTALPGVGNAGFGFQLDATQAAAANSFLAANPTLRIGASATATGANSGPETIQITSLGSVQPGGGGSGGAVPEPSTYLMLSGGLLVLAKLRKTKLLSR